MSDDGLDVWRMKRDFLGTHSTSTATHCTAIAHRGFVRTLVDLPFDFDKMPVLLFELCVKCFTFGVKVTTFFSRKWYNRLFAIQKDFGAQFGCRQNYLGWASQ